MRYIKKFVVGEQNTFVVVSGTLSGANEADIVAGGKTYILTIKTSDTWVATLGDDNQATTDFLAGITGSLSAAGDWDNEVTLVHGGLTRTSDTVMTLVVPATAAYNIVANETLTHVIPASSFTNRTVSFTPVTVPLLWVNPLTWGVAGAVTSDGFTVTAELVSSGDASLVVATNSTMATVVKNTTVVSTTTTPFDGDGNKEIVKLVVTGLDADTEYWWSIRTDDGAVDPDFTGHIPQTAPASLTAKNFKFLVYADMSLNLVPITADGTQGDERVMQILKNEMAGDSELSFGVNLGDRGYSNHVTDTQTTVNKMMRDMLLNHAEYQVLLKECPEMYTWSDHDSFGGNDGRRGTPASFVSGMGKLRTAYGNFHPHYPLFAQGAADIRPIGQTWTWGRTCFIMPDTQSQRIDSDGTMVGDGRTDGGEDLTDQMQQIKDAMTTFAADGYKYCFFMSAPGFTQSGSQSWEGIAATEWDAFYTFISTLSEMQVFLIGGDTHTGQVDDGRSTALNFRPNDDAILPTFQSTPLFRSGGSGSLGSWDGTGTGNQNLTSQYGIIEVVDNGTTINVLPVIKGFPLTVLDSDLVTNGTFGSDTGWTKGTGWTITGGKAVKAAGTGSDLEQNQTVTQGANYDVTFTISDWVAGTVTPVVGGTLGIARGADGTFTETIVAGSGSDPKLEFRANAAADMKIDDVLHAKELAVGSFAATALENETTADASTANRKMDFTQATITVSVGSGGGDVTVTVEKDWFGPVGGVATVDWATADGTATVANGDYNAASGTLTFKTNERKQSFTVHVNDDEIENNGLTFTVSLSNYVNCAAGSTTTTNLSGASLAVNFSGTAWLEFYNATPSFDSTKVTFAVAVKRDGNNTEKIFRAGGFNVNVLGTDLVVTGNAVGGGTAFSYRSSTAGIGSGSWKLIMFSCDMSSTSLRHVYVGDVDNEVTPGGTWSAYDISKTIDFTGGSGKNWFQGWAGSGTKYKGDMMGLFLHQGVYIDLDTEANRRKMFTAAGKVLDLRSDLTAFTGSQPGVYSMFWPAPETEYGSQTRLWEVQGSFSTADDDPT